MPLQFIEHILLGIFIYSLIPFLIGIEPKLQLAAKEKWWKGVVFISSITLEVFLVMDYAIDYVEMWMFPVSLLSAMGGIALVAWTLHLVQKLVSEKLLKMIEGKDY